MDQDRIMKVTDENGNEVEMYILFTTRLEEYNKNYIFYIDIKADDEEVFVSSYTEDNRLHPVTEQAEWDALEEVFNDFIEEGRNYAENHKDNDCDGNCNKNCDEGCDQACDGCCNQEEN